MRQNKQYSIILIGLFLLLAFCLPHASALNITNETGDSFIQWKWDDTINNANVSIDGNTPFLIEKFRGQYTLTDLKYNELHRIDIEINGEYFYQETYTKEYFFYTTYFYLLAASFILLMCSSVITMLALPSFFISFLFLWQTFLDFQTDINFPYFLAFGISILAISGLRMGSSW